MLYQFLSISYILNVHGLVCTTESTFESVKRLKSRLEDKLETETSREERLKIKHLLRKLSSLTPMTACGYFEISKDTMISMLSVRYSTINGFFNIY